MNGALPLSDDFLYWDPERVMEFLAPSPNEADAARDVAAPIDENTGTRRDED